ncbi:MAG: GntR family transcriptional regulator [Chloroflexota bacterium]|nr:GntR family transcriptional regulator [Chloroflexota bacterium]
MSARRSDAPRGRSDFVLTLWRERTAASSASEAVYDALREGILHAELPPGARLGEEELARRFGVSRTPVREALLRLEADRLATRAPRRGYVVQRITAGEVLEVYAVRQVIDGLSARLAAVAALPAHVVHLRWLNDELRSAERSGDAKRTAEVNVTFHEFIAEAAGNEYLLRFVREIHDSVRRFPGTTLTWGRRGSAAYQEHKDLIAAIDAHDPDRAERTAREHMAKALDARIAMLRKEGVMAPEPRHAPARRGRATRRRR